MRGIHETRGVVRCLCSLREGERIVVISYYLLSINLVNIQICYKYPYRTAYGAYARVTFDSLTGLPIKLEANAAHGFRYDVSVDILTALGSCIKSLADQC